MVVRNRETPSLLRRWFRRAVVGVAAAAAAALILILGLAGLFGYLQVQSRRPVTLPAPTGDHPVGRAMYDWTETGGDDPLAPTPRPRELSVWVWYPGRSVAGATRAPYLPMDWQRAFQGTDFTHTRANVVTTHSWVDLPPASTGRPLPVLVFMPGYGRIAADYTTQMEDLASHGYVVFAINPTYVSDAVVLEGGRVVPENRRLTIEADRGIDGADTEVTEVEAADMRFVLRRATQLDASRGDRFSGRLDVARAGFFGHSIGGAASTRACELDTRCAGAVNMDGNITGPVVEQGIHKPYLFLGEDPSLNPVPRADLAGVLRGQSSNGEVFTVTGAGHFDFSDVGVLYRFPPNEFGAVGPIAGGRAVTITRAYLRAFFGEHLLGTPSPLLSGRPSPYPEVKAVHV